MSNFVSGGNVNNQNTGENKEISMGIEKAGIKLFNSITRQSGKKVGKSVLFTKRPIFHGINPTLTYPATGKSFALPRFCTEEMKEARQMNKIAIHQAKAGKVAKNYPKATLQDLKRLTSETIEDSYSRVEWTNPKDGKIYNLLKQGETKEGKIAIRILDEEGAFVKEAELTPKKIIIIDDISQKENLSFSDNFGLDCAHGDGVQIFAKRNNPFANYEIINNSDDSFIAKFLLPEDKLEAAIRKIITKIETGEKIDFINFSWGCEKNLNEYIKKYGKDFFQLQKNSEYLMMSEEMNEVRNLFKLLSKLNDLAKEKGIRILNAAGNGGKNSQGMELFFENIEGVGSLSNKGKISNFSASRSSKFTQHYELGEYEIVATPKGINITGKKGTDIPVVSKYHESEFLGKNIKDTIIPNDLFNKLLVAHKNFEKDRRLYHQEWAELFKEYRQKYLFSTEQAEKIGFSNPQLKSEYIHIPRGFVFSIDKKGKLIPFIPNKDYSGTSFSTPVRTAKLALNDMMEGVL